MSYTGSITNRLDTLWQPGLLYENGLPVYTDSLAQMRNRSRSLERNNVLASAVLDRACENVIGTGIKLRAITSSPPFNDRINGLWRRAVEGKFFDVRRTFSFDQMQRMVYRASLRDGDCALLLVDRGAGPELQVIEGDMIDSPYKAMEPRIVDGVELNDANAPRAYHLRSYRNGIIDRERALARDVVFLMRTSRYNVVRGEPAFHGMYSLFDQIVGLLDAVVVAMRVGASQALIVKKKRPGNTGLRTLTTNAIGEDVGAKPIEPGMINFVYTDEGIEGFQPTQPGQSFPEAIRTFARFVGLKFGLTLERVLLDFSQANYSVSRSTALQEQKTADIEQNDFNTGVLARVWPWFVAKHVKAGNAGSQIPEDAWRYEWIPPARPPVDELSDMRAKAMAIELGVDSRRNVAAERGYEFAQLVADNKDDTKLLADAGLPTSVTMGRPAQPAGTTQAKPRRRDDDDEPEGDDDADDNDE